MDFFDLAYLAPLVSLGLLLLPVVRCTSGSESLTAHGKKPYFQQ